MEERRKVEGSEKSFWRCWCQHTLYIYTPICIYRYIFFELVNGERLHSGLKKHLGWSKKIILSTDYSRFERLIL